MYVRIKIIKNKIKIITVIQAMIQTDKIYAKAYKWNKIVRTDLSYRKILGKLEIVFPSTILKETMNGLMLLLYYVTVIL